VAIAFNILPEARSDQKPGVYKFTSKANEQ